MVVSEIPVCLEIIAAGFAILDIDSIILISESFKPRIFQRSNSFETCGGGVFIFSLYQISAKSSRRFTFEGKGILGE
jgi:hypothetical protein